MRVHTAPCPGLLESAHKECLFYESVGAGRAVVKEKPMPLIYDEVRLDCGYRLDLLYESKVVVGIKAVNCRIGLLMNFNVASLKNGIRRVIL